MIVSELDASWAADEFINYFENFTSIEDYLRYVKKELVTQTSQLTPCLLYTSPSPRDRQKSRMPSSA